MDRPIDWTRLVYLLLLLAVLLLLYFRNRGDED